ncbi:MAG: response regulator transcription factor [bacterium]
MGAGEPIRILLADDHTIVRQGLARLLEDQPGFRVVGEAENGKVAVEKALALKPDVIIMDIAMPFLNGIEASKRIKKLLPKVKILVLSMYAQENHVHELLQAGVSGYLLKESSGRDITTAIEAAIRNEAFLSPTISKLLMDSYLSPRKTSPKEQRYNELSNREREVFQLLAEGHSTKEVADLLCVSVSTIKTHRINIMEKLGISTNAQLIRFAIQLGLVAPD